MIKRNKGKDRLRGASLTELLILVMVAGVLTAVVGKLVTTVGNAPDEGQPERTLQASVNSLVGYTMVNAHLPPAEDNWLPADLSGSIEGNRVRYFVAPALTQLATDRFNPHGLIPAPTGNSAGLDFCKGLMKINPGSLLQMGSGSETIPVVAILEYVTSGKSAESVADVALPGTPLAITRAVDKRVSRGVSALELFDALGCTQRISRTAAAAKYQWAMLDALDLAKENTMYRENDLKAFAAGSAQAELSLAQLAVSMALLAMDYANLEAGHLAKMPSSAINEIILFRASMAWFVSAIANLGVQIDLVKKSIDQRPALAEKLQLTASQAKTNQDKVDAALADAKSELAYYAKLGLTP